MKAIFSVLAMSFFLAACASSSKDKTGGEDGKLERNAGATSLTVTTESNAREVLQSVPQESALERFEVLDTQGRLVSYVGLTDTAFGGVVFVDQKLVGTLSRRDAQAFYSCRGYATATQNHWAKDASAWTATLLSSAEPATTVQLDFSGLTSIQSIKGVVANPMINQVKSLLDMGSNPLNIIKTLYSARDNVKERDDFEKIQAALNALAPGVDESQVAAIIKPQDVSFVSDGLVMAYPKYSVEFYSSGGVVRTIQQPSFYQLSRNQAALFYAANAQWALCTPAHWKQALPDRRKTVKIDESAGVKTDIKVDVKADTAIDVKAESKPAAQ